jgi:Forkhead domain
VEDKDSSDLSSPESRTPTPPSEFEAEKPDIPYATLIAQSLLSHPRRRRMLQEIYSWIQYHHAWFNGRKGWQSSIRHNLASSPAFVPYGPKTNGNQATDKKTKPRQDEWGISPEYEGLIGNLSAREGDTDKISTKLSKKKAAALQQPKPKQTPPPPPPPPPPAILSPTPPPAPTQTEDKSKLEMLVKNMQGKGVDMGALLQEALAKMKGLPVTRTPQPSTPQPLIKKQRIGPSTASLTPFPAFGNTIQKPKSTINGQSPISMPMPLPYNPLKITSIPIAGSPQIKQETALVAPAAVIPPTQPTPVLSPVLSPGMPFKGPIPSASPPIPVNPAEPATLSPPILSDDLATSEKLILEPPKLAVEINGEAEPATSKQPPCGKKRGHNGD